MNKHQRIWSYITDQPWLLTESGLEQIAQIASRQGDVEAVLAKRGERLEETSRVIMRDGVAVLPIRGPIFRYANLFTMVSGATSVAMAAQDFQRALDDPSVRAIIPWFDTPGGEANGINEFAQMIFEARGQKPIKAYVGNMAASAGQWLSSAADETVIDPTASLGSIGVVIGYYKKSESDRLEIVSTVSPKKRLDPESEAGQAELLARADALAEIFVGAVARNRGMTREQVLAIEGGLVIGEQAIAAGLADRLGSLEGLIAELQKQTTPRLSWPAASSASAPAEAQPKTEGEDMTPEELRAKYPEACQEIYNQGQAAGSKDKETAVQEARTDAATIERERIQGVLDLGKKPAENTAEATLRGLAFDGETTKEAAAYKLLTARQEKGKQAAQDLAEDAAEIPVVDNTSGEEETSADEREAAVANMVAGAANR